MQEFFLEEAVNKVLSAASAPDGVAVHWTTPDSPIAVCVDRGQIERILANLVTNALQAMPGGGELKLRVTSRDESAVAEITDTGLGIVEENIAKVFEPLYTTKVSGMGLGLAISKTFAEVNCEKIEAESKPGRQTTFRLLLPLLHKRNRPFDRQNPRFSMLCGESGLVV